MKVIKRNGSTQQFDWDKIEVVLQNAFKAVNKEFTNDIFNDIVDELYFGDKDGNMRESITVEELQDQIEQALFECDHFDVMKAFILYRDDHKRTREFANKKIDYINTYIKSDNTANATIDDNSNVGNHNIAVLNSEIHKEENRDINIKILENKLEQLYPKFNHKQLHKDLNSICYLHDSSSQVGMPYCVAISMYPFLTNGLKDLGGLSASPKNIDSFCGMFVNLVFAIASQFKGAVATPGMLLCMDYFLRKEWGNSYHEKQDLVITTSFSNRVQTIKGQIHQYFQQICYSLMQPAAARGNQAVFWNLSIFDKPFYDTMYGDFRFPDNSEPCWESFNWLQKEFLHWLNQERVKCILTFPVVSACLIYQDNKFLDNDLYEFICKEYSEGNSFFTYISDSADSLSSCCRLSSKLEKPQFNFTNGQLSEMTGSKNVITLNMNRIIQDWYWKHERFLNCSKDGRAASLECEDWQPSLKEYLISILERVYKYQTAYNECLKELFNANMLPAYSAGFINLKKQYLTIGINGLNQAAEFLLLKCNKNDDYKDFCNLIFTTIKEENQKHKTPELMFNTEFTPCESAAIKLYNRDKADGYWVPEDTNLYASYIYKPNDAEISVLDKFILHGSEYCGDNLDGGSAAHINLDSHLSASQYKALLNHAAEVGCKYFTFNIPNSECEDCGYITKSVIDKCPKCGSNNISLWDRVIGYLTKITNWSEGRQKEQKTRIYHKKV